MQKLIQFGEEVHGYKIRVLNEREIRAAAGIMFVAIFLSLMFVIFKKDFLLIKYVISAFLLDFIIRVIINPKFSPTLIIGRLIVGGQSPEYVGAPQKRFAWTIGLFLSTTMFILLVLVNSYSAITGWVCLICLVFLFFETAFGICLGCLFYPLFFKQKQQNCSGEVCDKKSKHDIQKVTLSQFLILFSFVALITATAWIFNDKLNKQPSALFETDISTRSR